MDKLSRIKEKQMTEAYTMLADVIRSYEPDRLCEGTIQSLRFMLKHETFAPIHEVIEDKILEIAEYFRKQNEQYVETNLDGKPLNKPKRGPTRDNRKKKKAKVANAGDLPEPSLTMNFKVDPNTGLLMPVKK